MEHNLDISVKKPFGPVLGKVNIPNYLINKLNDFVDETIDNNTELGNELDHGNKLVGQVSQEIKISEDLIKSDMNDYLYNITKGYIELAMKREVKNFKIMSAWIVRQFENEYNPIHYHNGHISGAGYIKLPDSFGDTLQKGKVNYNGNINFIHGVTQFLSDGHTSITPKVGDFYIFPNYLYHSVNPFYGTGERRSLSFNALIDNEIFDVYSPR